MVGTYTAGKTTWKDDFINRMKETGEEWNCVSVDNIRDQYASEQGVSIDEIYSDDAVYTGYADAVSDALDSYLKLGKNVIIDSTNITKDIRGKWLNLVKNSGHPYRKLAVIKLLSREEAKTRFEEARDWSETKLIDHINAFESEGLPELEEGFDQILQIPTDKYRRESWVELVRNSQQPCNSAEIL